MTSATAMPSKSGCHTGNSVVYKHPETGAELSIGGTNRKGVAIGLCIDLRENVDPPEALHGNSAAMRILAKTAIAIQQPYANMPIRDFGVPNWPKRGVETLAADVAACLANKLSVSILCGGGHGRSGMVTAVVLHLIDPTDEHPVTRIRRLHCPWAVETKEQLKWVAEMTGTAYDASMYNEPPKSAFPANDTGNGTGTGKYFNYDEWKEGQKLYTTSTTASTGPNGTGKYDHRGSGGKKEREKGRSDRTLGKDDELDDIGKARLTCLDCKEKFRYIDAVNTGYEPRGDAQLCPECMDRVMAEIEKQERGR